MEWLEEVDPELRAFVRGGGPVLGDLTIDELRTLYSQRRDVRPAPATPGIAVTDVEADGVPMRVYSRSDAGVTRRSCIYAIHGGGFIAGSHLMNAAVLATLALELGCVCVSVDYRLAPEDQYPAAIDDCDTGLSWLRANSDALGLDAERVVVSGVSAGGALATSLALRVRDRGEAVAGLLLEAPTLDDRDATPSRSWELPIAGPSTIRLGWLAYVGGNAGSPSVPADAAPARATDLAGLPPTFIGVGTIDTLHDECVAFAQRLAAAGVDVTLREYRGAVHGFATLAPESSLAQRLRADQAEWLAQHLTR